jgi:hypothetical protein
MTHYFKLIGKPVYFGYCNGRTIRIKLNPHSITVFPRAESDDYQIFSAGSEDYEAIGAERFSNILTEANEIIQKEIQLQLSLSIIKN